MATAATDILKLSNVRIAFPKLFQPEAFKGEGKEYFSAAFILEKDSPQAKKVEAAIQELAKAQWKDKADSVLKTLRGQDKIALHDGDLKATYEGFADNFYIQASNKVRPTVLDESRNPLVESDGKPYAGCYVNAHIQLWAQDNQYGKRINATLCGVQFVRDGDAFGGGGRVSDAEDFEDISTAEALTELV